jgi:hypothetical protein
MRLAVNPAYKDRAHAHNPTQAESTICSCAHPCRRGAGQRLAAQVLVFRAQGMHLPPQRGYRRLLRVQLHSAIENVNDERQEAASCCSVKARGHRIPTMQRGVSQWPASFRYMTACHRHHQAGSKHLDCWAVADVLGARCIAQRAERLLDCRRCWTAAGNHQRQGRATLQK